MYGSYLEKEPIFCENQCGRLLRRAGNPSLRRGSARTIDLRAG
jgi:hypothetical protein